MINLSTITDWHNNALLYKICIIEYLQAYKYVRSTNNNV